MSRNLGCPICPQPLSYALIDVIDQACGPCRQHITQMWAGFRGVTPQPVKKVYKWDNSAAYEEWKGQLTAQDEVPTQLKKSDNEVFLYCDIRDMKRVCGYPKFLELEKQVFTSWILEGQKDERSQEVLGLTYSQLTHLKKVVKFRLQKQMAYYRQIQKLEREGKTNASS